MSLNFNVVKSRARIIQGGFFFFFFLTLIHETFPYNPPLIKYGSKWVPQVRGGDFFQCHKISWVVDYFDLSLIWTAVDI